MDVARYRRMFIAKTLCRAPFPTLRFIPVVSVLLATAAGCVPGEDTGAFGLASIEEVWVNLHHRDGTLELVFTAKLTRAEGSCPPLAEDLTITANDQPLALSLYDGSDAITFGCTVSSLDGSATLPDTGGPLRIAFAQGPRTASMVIADSAFPAFGAVSMSRTEVPVGESFAVEVAVAGADATTRELLASPYDWVVSLCAPSGCVPGEGWIGLTLINGGARDVGLGFDVVVPNGVAPGEYLMGVHAFDPGFFPMITECKGLPICLAYNNSNRDWEYGPYAFEVL
jgi:hypothetical protein